MAWKEGDWVIFDLSVGQIKEIRDGGESFTDGMFETSGRLADRFRPLTLKNKRVVETFEVYYDRLKDIDGNAEFNYPDIHRHFSQLALDAIDGDVVAATQAFDKGRQFSVEARDYKAEIQGVRLFRPAPRRASEQ